jgi:flavin reductase (DIM6/NTAB) family NADH-FMN oxidoreductase RutF
MTPVDSAVFRELCGRFPTGVVVVTTVTADGTPLGMTANSFTSVSLDPPLVSVNVDHKADLLPHILRAPYFIINILANDQEAVSRRFAGDRLVRFEERDFGLGAHGVPILDGTVAWIGCARHAAFEAGDHTIVVGLVTDGKAGRGRPLLYYRGGYLDPGPV